MSRFNALLFAALIFSGLALVHVSYEARRLFVAVERAHNEERRLEIEYGRLQVDKRAEATPLRVERLAREKLEMRAATPGVTHYVSLPGASGLAAVAEAVAGEEGASAPAAASAQEAAR